MVPAPLQPYLATMRAKWAAFATRNPKTARVTSAVGALIRWGFYFVLFLILGVWIGLFGGLPSSDELRSIETANATTQTLINMR